MDAKIFWSKLAAVIATLYALFHLYTAGFGFMPNLIQRSMHVGLAMVLCFIITRGGRSRTNTPNIFDIVAMVISAFMCIYIIYSYDRIIESIANSTAMDMYLGAATTILVLITARRTMGWIFPIIAVIALLYAYFGPYIPGTFGHAGISIQLMLQQLFLSSQGLWGITTQVTSTVVAIYIVFGVLIMKTGGGQAFVDFAKWIAGWAKGGSAKVAVISSALFGMINGSAAANAAVVGTLTIPMMKKAGFRAEYAAAVEAVASSGGNIMPPIMGTAAFIMAELINIPYSSIMIAAAIPATLYFFGALMNIHFESVRSGLKGLPPSEIPKRAEVFKISRISPLVVPVIILLAMIFSGYTVERAGFWSTVAVIVLYLIPASKSLTELKKRLRDVLSGLTDSGKSLVMIGIMAAVAQIVVSMIAVTGLSITFSNIIIETSGTSLLFTFFLSMIVCLILGMGLPTAPAYILGASVLAPSLTKLGVEPLVAHMFIFYFTTISAFTPPVCAAVYVTAGIAGADWWKTGLIACRLGLVTFIVPYTFIYSQALLFKGSMTEIISALLTATLGTLSLAAGTMNCMLVKNKWYEGIILIASGILLVTPGNISDLIGFLGLMTVFSMQYIRRKKSD